MSATTVDPPPRSASPERGDHHLASAPPGPADATPPLRRRAGAVLDRWPFRRKLNVLVSAPVLVVGLLLGAGVVDQVDRARDAGRIADLVRDSEQVARLINDVQAEHRQALVLSVRYESARPGAALPSPTDYRRAQEDTDAQVAAVRSAFGSNLPAEETQALEYIDSLAVLRDKLGRGYVPAANIDPAYASAVDYLIDGIGLDRFSGTSSSSVTTLLDTVLRADSAHAAYESAVFSAQTRDANALTEYTRAVGAHALFDHQSDRFSRIATPEQVLSLSGIERSAEESGIESQFAELQIDPSSLQNQTPQQLRKEIAAGAQQAETRLGITRSLIRQIAAQADSTSASALREALVLLGWPCSASPPGWPSPSWCGARSYARWRHSPAPPSRSSTWRGRNWPASPTTRPPTAPRCVRGRSRSRYVTRSVSWPRRSTRCRSPRPRCWSGRC